MIQKAFSLPLENLEIKLYPKRKRWLEAQAGHTKTIQKNLALSAPFTYKRM